MDKKKYWYKFYEVFCPVCGETVIYPKERKYTKKPKEYWKRHIYSESYNYCNLL